MAIRPPNTVKQFFEVINDRLLNENLHGKNNIDSIIALPFAIIAIINSIENEKNSLHCHGIFLFQFTSSAQFFRQLHRAFRYIGAAEACAMAGCKIWADDALGHLQ
jgi:hypothetical protein